MVKKISAIFLALVLCLSVMVVPVSAYELASGSRIAYVVTTDKEYYSAGETVTINLYMYGDASLQYAAGAVVFGCHSDVFDQSENDAADVKASATTGETAGTFYKHFEEQTWAWQTNTTIYNNIVTNNTDEENELFDQFIKVAIARQGTSTGTHANSQNTKLGYPGSDMNAESEAGIPFVSFQLKLRDDLADGTKVNVGIPTGPMAKNYTYINVFSDPGNATTVTKTSQSDSEVVWATATKGVAPCENHTWDNGVVTTEPTCGEAGVKTLTCTVCGSTSTEEVAATGNHTPSDEIVRENEKAASCSENGSYEAVVKCSVCGAEISRTTEVIEATGDHVYATEQSRVDATCTTPGSVTMACGCGATEVTEIPATGHSYASEVTAPTCTEAGYTTYTCSVCGDTYTADEVAATGHAYDEAVTAPTCTEAGYTTYTCSVCGDTYTGNEVAATGHAYDEAVTAPTCTEAGYTTYTCSACGDTYTGNEVAAAGHAYEITYTKQPSCAKTGLNEYTCSVCGDSYDEEIPAKGHTEVVVEGKAPTCVDAGYSDYTVCSVCNSVVTPKTTLPATGHTKDEGVVTEPTYTSKGYTTYTCTECGVTFQDDWTDMLEADFTISIKEPSITAIRCQDTIVLHPVIDGGNPEGLDVVWTADNENFTMTELEDGSLEITSIEDGYTVFTASLVDASGNVVATDTVEMRSKANIWGKIGGFFRVLFGSNLYYNY